MTKTEDITLISGTNRQDSNTRLFTETLFRLLKPQTDHSIRILDLCELEGVDIQNSMFNPTEQHPIIKRLQDEYILPASKFIFIIPEYNGSYPGILKYFIDACSIRDYSSNFQNKSAFLIGVSTGRAGNLRGLDHLTSVLNYLQTHVHPVRLPVSKVTSIFDPQKFEFLDEELIGLFHQHLFPFINEVIPSRATQVS